MLKLPTPQDRLDAMDDTRFAQDRQTVAQQAARRMKQNQKTDFYNSAAYKASTGTTPAANTGMPTSISALMDAGATAKGAENNQYWRNNDLNLSTMDPTAERVRSGTVGHASTIGSGGFSQFEMGGGMSTALDALRKLATTGGDGGFDSPALARDMGNERLQAMRLANHGAAYELNRTPQDRMNDAIAMLRAEGGAQTDLEADRTIRRAQTAQNFDVRRALDDDAERQLALMQARYVDPAQIKGAADVEKASITAQGMNDRENIRAQQQGANTLLSLLSGLRKTPAWGDPVMQQQIEQGITFLQGLYGNRQFSPGVSALANAR